MTENKTDFVKLVIEGIQERKGRSITHVDLSGIESAAAQNFIRHFYHASICHCR